MALMVSWTVYTWFRVLWPGHSSLCLEMFLLGLKRYAQPTIRYDTRYICHSYLGSRGLWSLRSEALHSTDYNCLRSNNAQWLQQWRPPWSFHMQCLWWIHSFYWNILIVFWDTSCSFLTLACVTSVPYRIVSSSERIAIRTVAFISAIYRCIVSALILTPHVARPSAAPLLTTMQSFPYSFFNHWWFPICLIKLIHRHAIHNGISNHNQSQNSELQILR